MSENNELFFKKIKINNIQSIELFKWSLLGVKQDYSTGRINSTFSFQKSVCICSAVARNKDARNERDYTKENISVRDLGFEQYLQIMWCLVYYKKK